MALAPTICLTHCVTITKMQKRLGDGFYEQRLINEQIHQLTGRRFLDNYQTDDEQYKALMDSGIYYAKKFNLLLVSA